MQRLRLLCSGSEAGMKGRGAATGWARGGMALVGAEDHFGGDEVEGGAEGGSEDGWSGVGCFG